MLRGKLEDLSPRSTERQHLLQECADLHDVSVATVYRALREQFHPRSLHRRDRGRPRRVHEREMERFCELWCFKLRAGRDWGRASPARTRPQDLPRRLPLPKGNREARGQPDDQWGADQGRPYKGNRAW